jgi:hypothetical protein
MIIFDFSTLLKSNTKVLVEFKNFTLLFLVFEVNVDKGGFIENIRDTGR